MLAAPSGRFSASSVVSAANSQFSGPALAGPPFLYRNKQYGYATVEVIFMPKQPKPKRLREKPIPDFYPVLDNDLARDNLENDLPAADLEDL